MKFCLLTSIFYSTLLSDVHSKIQKNKACTFLTELQKMKFRQLKRKLNFKTHLFIKAHLYKKQSFLTVNFISRSLGTKLAISGFSAIKVNKINKSKFQILKFYILTSIFRSHVVLIHNFQIFKLK